MPGLMALTRILRWPSSLASVLVMASTAPLTRAEFLGQRSGDGIDRALCAGVNRRTRRCQRRDCRANVYNVAAIGTELLDRFLGGEEQAENIHVKVFVELFLGDLFKWRPIVNAGVVDQNVERAECLLRCGKEPFDFRLPGDVGLDGDSFAAAFCNFVHDAVCALF